MFVSSHILSGHLILTPDTVCLNLFLMCSARSAGQVAMVIWSLAKHNLYTGVVTCEILSGIVTHYIELSRFFL